MADSTETESSREDEPSAPLSLEEIEEVLEEIRF
jgi:hypothetical protein